MEQDELKRLGAARDALDPLRQGMAADGYILHVQSLSAGTISVRIEATSGACEECLVPKEVLAGIIRESLPESLGVRQVLLTYPRD